MRSIICGRCCGTGRIVFVVVFVVVDGFTVVWHRGRRRYGRDSRCAAHLCGRQRGASLVNDSSSGSNGCRVVVVVGVVVGDDGIGVIGMRTAIIVVCVTLAGWRDCR